jgi:hypothetical protein
MGYDEKLVQQIDQYKNVEEMHIHAEIVEYWKGKYVRDAWRNMVSPAIGHFQFYSNQFASDISITGNGNILSIGSGDGKIEVGVARHLLKTHSSFVFELLELSPYQIERAKGNVEAAGLTKYFRFTETDLNTWVPDKQYAGIMAHHSLHHVVNLEGLFDRVKSALAGSFCTMDMIGRNGHMRWPEVLKLVQLFWGILPEKKRIHSGLPGFEKGFYNHDCSTEGFEGIRSQDILPCLIEKFGFKVFFAFGGLIDPFVGRGFGRHYDPRDDWDRAFIDLVAYLNDLLIELGHIKPTQMYAVMSNNIHEVPVIYKNRTPEFCVRPSGADF